MTTREEFEVWYGSRNPEHIGYAWDAWQASRAAALEEAAKECDLMQAMFERQSLMNEADAAEQCAMGIRALK